MRTVIYLLIALFFGGLTLWLVNSRLDVLADSLPTTGVIVDVQGGSSGKTSRPVVRFTTAKGQVIEQAVFRLQHTSTWDKGETLPILYRQSDPQHAMVNEFRTLWNIEIFCGLLALGFWMLFLRQLLPASTSGDQGLKDIRVLCLVPAFFAFLFAIKMMVVS
ncbi:DUF3592 domain-containing protein [Nitrincola alkalilacustris]|uniref:DUF3592 domain-containing protein n=1 Tax=Nitrincola alkalilacustris TaxID=1571224 RepID=UPI00124D2C10|nr:DUF3592 domain-containing protein [Nitrincola alkalilacustris]